jgi:hypothetical protein
MGKALAAWSEVLWEMRSVLWKGDLSGWALALGLVQGPASLLVPEEARVLGQASGSK